LAPPLLLQSLATVVKLAMVLPEQNVTIGVSPLDHPAMPVLSVDGAVAAMLFPLTVM
jgi:hypothetical protein